TTNLAAIATEVPLYTHIRGMLYTTLPSALVALAVFTTMGWARPVAVTEVNSPEITAILTQLESLWRFNLLLLLPPLLVLVGSLNRWPTLPVLLGSAVLAILLALLFQPFGLSNTLLCLVRGFHTDMATASLPLGETVQNLVNRGGMYQLNEAIMFTLMVFVFIGSLDITQAMPGLVTRVFGWVKSRKGIVLAALGATAFTNATTSNQSATSFVVGDAFRSRFDALGVPRSVLSRSIEDYGTMLESLIPWTATAVFMAATTGVAWADYAPWQLLTLANLVIAPLWVLLGIGMKGDQK
ncbi:MAG: Na+/H+ antiporter NhaC family protein, partial [Bacteroidota bacterium]